MEIVAVWLIFAIIVGVAANTRGRNGFGWFALAVVISPLLAGLLVLALPAATLQAGQTKASATFTPEGVLGGVPYRVAPDGRIEAMLPGGRVTFRTIEQLSAVVSGETIELAKPIDRQKYPHQLNEFYYRVERNRSVCAVTSPGGEEQRFRTYKDFWNHANRIR